MSFDANAIPLFRFVNRDVHPNDEMFKTAKLSMPEEGKAFHYYFFSGGRLAERLRDYLLETGYRPARMSVLDFACGYGRVTRYLALIFNRVTAADLEPEMTAFVGERFADEAFLSDTEVDRVALSGRYDLVFSFSLFTHLSPESWRPWFARLASAVKPGGLFIFSTRSPEFARARGEAFDDAKGIMYARKNETAGRLDLDTYGETTVSRAFVDGASSDTALERVAFFPGGAFDLYHDMHVFKCVA